MGFVVEGPVQALPKVWLGFIPPLVETVTPVIEVFTILTAVLRLTLVMMLGRVRLDRLLLLRLLLWLRLVRAANHTTGGRNLICEINATLDATAATSTAVRG